MAGFSLINQCTVRGREQSPSTSVRTPVSQPVVFVCTPLCNPSYNTHNHKGKLLLLKGVNQKIVQPFDRRREGVKGVGQLSEIVPSILRVLLVCVPVFFSGCSLESPMMVCSDYKKQRILYYHHSGQSYAKISHCLTEEGHRAAKVRALKFLRRYEQTRERTSLEDDGPRHFFRAWYIIWVVQYSFMTLVALPVLIPLIFHQLRASPYS